MDFDDGTKTGNPGKDIKKKKGKEKSKNKQKYTEPPDGGYGWVVVMACFFCNMVADGTGWAFGVLVKPLTTEFGARFALKASAH